MREGERENERERERERENKRGRYIFIVVLLTCRFLCSVSVVTDYMVCAVRPSRTQIVRSGCTDLLMVALWVHVAVIQRFFRWKTDQAVRIHRLI